MSIITKPHTFADNEIIYASKLNENFNKLYDEINGNVDTVNIKDEAVTSEKLTNTIGFRAYRSSALNASTSITKINMDTESFDTGSDWDGTTNYRFNAPKAGYYYFEVSIGFADPGDQVRVLAYIYVNDVGATVAQVGSSGAANDPTAKTSLLTYLEADDYVDPRMNVTSGTPAVNNSSSYTYFQGWLVGA